MTGSEYRVLFLLISQYRGNNNGDLSATESMMESRGGMAGGTLRKALQGLQDRNLIVKTRTNYRGENGMVCNLYAFTWINIHECPGKNLEINPTQTPIRKLGA